MDPEAIDAARALLPPWVSWANLAVAAPLASVTTALALLLAAAVATPPAETARDREGLAASTRPVDMLVALLPALWAISVAASAGPIGRVRPIVLVAAVGASSFAAAMFARAVVRARLRAAEALFLAPWTRRGAGAVALAVGLTLLVAAPLRVFVGQAWSRSVEARVFAVALTGGHDRTLADHAWVTAQRGDQLRAAVFLRAALVAEASVVPAANLAIVYANVGRCAEATRALQETSRRLAATRPVTPRDRELAAAASQAVQNCGALTPGTRLSGGT